jgi:hypothetical protein
MKSSTALQSSVSIAVAHSIMGENFLGPDEVRRGFGIELPDEAFATVPFGAQRLMHCRDTHILFAGAPLTLNQIVQFDGNTADFTALVARLIDDNDWYHRELFANERQVEARWHLMRREALPGSGGLTFKEQVARLSSNEEVPPICELVYMILLHWIVRQERLFQDICLRCDDRDRSGCRITLDSYEHLSIHAGQYVDDICYGDMAITTSLTA